MTVLCQLRDIEILVQQQLEENEKSAIEDVTLLEIQKILYSTEVLSPFSFQGVITHFLRRRVLKSRMQPPRSMRKRLTDHALYLRFQQMHSLQFLSRITISTFSALVAPDSISPLLFLRLPNRTSRVIYSCGMLC